MSSTYPMTVHEAQDLWRNATMAQFLAHWHDPSPWASHLDWILRQPNPACTADSLGMGQWYANDVESWIAYEALAKAIRAGMFDERIASLRSSAT